MDPHCRKWVADPEDAPPPVLCDSVVVIYMNSVAIVFDAPLVIELLYD